MFPKNLATRLMALLCRIVSHPTPSIFAGFDTLRLIPYDIRRDMNGAKKTPLAGAAGNDRDREPETKNRSRAGELAPASVQEQDTLPFIGVVLCPKYISRLLRLLKTKPFLQATL
jgi:hypothetical protein